MRHVAYSLGEKRMYCAKQVMRCLYIGSTYTAQPVAKVSYQGSIAKTLEAMKTPYVEMRDTTIRAKIGVPKFFTAWTVHNMAQTSILQCE